MNNKRCDPATDGRVGDGPHTKVRGVFSNICAALVTGAAAIGIVFSAPSAAMAASAPTAQISERQVAKASSARVELERFINEVATASGSFEQTTFSVDGKVLDEQQGEFLFARPGQFRWEITAPFPQLVVATGDEVIQYDPDLLQATIRPASSAVGNAPAQVLFGGGDIDEAFNLEPLARSDGLSWLRALPISAEAGFAHLDIGLRNGLPQQVEILDAFGQTSRIVFTQIVPNPDLPSHAFVFNAPEGVDVVRMQ